MSNISGTVSTNGTISGTVNVSGGGYVLANEVIADDYSSTATYAVGNFCIHDGLLYQCTTAVTEAEEFDADKWQNVKVVDYLGNEVTWSDVTGKPFETLSDKFTVTDGELDIDVTTDVYSKDETDALLADKADSTDVYDKTETDTLLDAKADAADVYTKTETDDILSTKADADSVYSKTETDALVADKADVNNVYTKEQTDNLLLNKADSSTTYTKTETDELLADKPSTDSVYSKTETDALLDDYVKGTDLATVATTGAYTDLTGQPTIDSAMSSTSTNAVQNKVVYEAIQSATGTTDYTLLTNKPQVNGVELTGNKSTSDLGIDVPTATSDLTNDSDFVSDASYVHTDNNYTTDEKTKLSGIEDNAEVNVIEAITVNGTAVTPTDKTIALTIMTKAVNDLANYYLKSETYTKAEVDALISAISTTSFKAVDSLPTTDISTTTIYLVPKDTTSTNNIKDEYINLDGTTSGWELIGDTEIDLSDYVTTTALNTALASYVTTTALTTALADYVTSSSLSTTLGSYYLKTETDTLLANKADASTTYTKTETDSLLDDKADADSVYTKTEADTLLTDKADADDVYTKTETDTLLDSKADQSTTYTKTEADSLLSAKQDTLTFDNTPTEASSNPVKSSGIYSGIVANTDLITDTVGWTGKNLIPFPYSDINKVSNGVTFTINPADGSITANGTSTGTTTFILYDESINGRLIDFENINYTLSGCPEGGSEDFGTGYHLDIVYDSYTKNEYEYGEGVTFSASPFLELEDVQIRIRIGQGATVDNVVFYPMLRKADIIDSTYEDYHISVENSLSDTNKLIENTVGWSKKNLIPYPYVNSDRTINGVTFTVNDSDCSITVNGTASETTTYNIYNELSQGRLIDFEDTGYILSGCPDGGDVDFGTGYHLDIVYDNATKNKHDYGQGAAFMGTPLVNLSDIAIRIRIASGVTVENLIFYPMLRKASISDDTYEPYHKTVAELLENIPTTLDDTVTQNSSNPVKSSGIYSALSAKQNIITFDSTPISGSSNAVTSGGVYAAIQAISPPSITYGTESLTEGVSSLETGTFYFQYT